MNQHVVESRNPTTCPHCKRDIRSRVLIIHDPQPDGSERSMWHCQECRAEWPREPAKEET